MIKLDRKKKDYRDVIDHEAENNCMKKKHITNGFENIQIKNGHNFQIEKS